MLDSRLRDHLKRLGVDALMFLSIVALCAAPFWLMAFEPWRPLAESLADLAELYLRP